MGLIEILLAIGLGIVAIFAVLHLFGRLWALVVNALLGLVTIWLVNYLDLLSSFGVGDISYTPAVVLICIFGGIPGAVIIIILAIAGIVV
jgi:hypothetical protein